MACIQSNYDVNVTRKEDGAKFQDGKARRVHFCKVELGFLQPAEAHSKFQQLCKQFPAPEFELEMTYWECKGRSVAERDEAGIAF